MWHVTMQVSGDPAPAGQIEKALRRVCEADPANMGARYAVTGAELQFWDEGSDIDQVVEAALAMWRRVRGSVGLPNWALIGIDVADLMLWRRQQSAARAAIAPGSVVRIN